MSIIYDALEKTQKSQINTEQKNINKSKIILKTIFIIFMVLILTATVYTIFHYYKLRHSLNAVIVPPTKLVNEMDYKKNHILNGIFLSDQDKIAFINNQTFHIGDIVDGMEIINIDFNTVKLAHDQQQFSLEVMSV